MLKYISIAVLTVLVAVSWFKFSKTGTESEQLREKIEQLGYDPENDDEVRALKRELNGREGERIFTGILLTFLSAGLFGIVFVTQVLPILANKLSTGVYASDEEVEADPFHDARVLLAQGDWDGAIKAFKLAAQKDPGNRMPWIEIAKIQRHQLNHPADAISTLRQAIESQDWEINDVAFLMFRLSEIYDEDFQDRTTGASILSQIIELFPETRHSANARTKLHEWGM